MTASEPPAEELLDRCSNLGRWGNDDELGTLNLIDASVVRRGVAVVTAGEVVALGRLPSPGTSVDGMTPVTLEVYQGPQRRDALDRQTIVTHGYAVTHLDALGHSFFSGRAYNGRHPDNVVRREGLTFAGIDAMAGGIVTRGVLLDVTAVRGKALSAEDAVTADDLDAAERRADVVVSTGDAVVVRTGVSGPPSSEGRRGGLVASAVEWLYRRDVALYAGDCIERLTPEATAMPMVLHQVGHVAMGLAILDNPDVEALADACRRHQRAQFLLVVAPLGLRGATGCAVNPLAVF